MPDQNQRPEEQLTEYDINAGEEWVQNVWYDDEKDEVKEEDDDETDLPVKEQTPIRMLCTARRVEGHLIALVQATNRQTLAIERLIKVVDTLGGTNA